MTPTTAIRLIWTTRRGVIGALVVWTVLVAALLFGVVGDYLRPSSIVRYGSEYYTPIDATLCPGETLSYVSEIVVSGNDIPAILHVVEGWYSETLKVTPRGTVMVYELPLVRPTDITVTVNRVVPDGLAPGVWWFNHVATNGHSTGYTVGPIEIVACE